MLKRMSEPAVRVETKVFAADPLINLPLLVASGFIYLTIVEWVEFARCSAIHTFSNFENEDSKKGRPEHKFWFAVFLTIVTVAILILIYSHYRR